jgi:hypothetical protein
MTKILASLLVAASCIAIAPAQAATVKKCDWVGAGPRADYRCRQVEAAPTTVRTPARVCGWVGAGPRADYHCRVQ